MSAARWIFALVVTLAATAGPALADCVPMRDARAMVKSGKIVPMGEALRAARGAARGDMIDGRLCHGGGGLQYVVTFLGPEGRVRRVTIDARSGAVTGVR
jgi:uncharacterized membrane protein YkoI